MKFMNKMERKFGKYAIPNLPVIIIGLEVIGYTLSVLAPKVLYYICFSPADICRGQVWRLITWVLMPPSRLDIFTVIMLFFYYWIARMLASTWGDFYFNVYLLGGIIITDVGMMIAYPIFQSIGSVNALMNIGVMSAYVNLYYIQTMILLAFAFTYPNAQALLFFFIPIKMSWLGIFEAVMLVYSFIRVGMATPRLVILLAALNMLVYFLMTKDLSRYRPSEFARRANYRKKTGQGGIFSGFGTHSQGQGRGTGRNTGAGRQGAPQGAGQRQGADISRRSASGYTKIYPNGARHKCTICGRTELDDERLEFRYCSKCEGNHEYCQDHLFTHQHIRNP